MRFEVKFYETTDGKKPVEDFLLSLENKMQAKMVQMMELLEEKSTRDVARLLTSQLKNTIAQRLCVRFTQVGPLFFQEFHHLHHLSLHFVL